MDFCGFGVLLSPGYLVNSSAENWGRKRIRGAWLVPDDNFCAIIMSWIEKKAKIAFMKI